VLSPQSYRIVLKQLMYNLSQQLKLVEKQCISRESTNGSVKIDPSIQFPVFASSCSPCLCDTKPESQNPASASNWEIFPNYEPYSPIPASHVQIPLHPPIKQAALSNHPVAHHAPDPPPGPPSSSPPAVPLCNTQPQASPLRLTQPAFRPPACCLPPAAIAADARQATAHCVADGAQRPAPPPPPAPAPLPRADLLEDLVAVRVERGGR
jgi:hypothetical protein